MTQKDWLAEEFEKNRKKLERVAVRMLGSRPEAEDALQEAWMRVGHAGTEGVENLGGWLTTIVARVCLDMLRSRGSRREVAEGDAPAPELGDPEATGDAEADLSLADSIGSALLVVLETLAPAERVAFVLHEMFDMTFEEIAPILGRSHAATRQLGSRARRRIQGEAPAIREEQARHREIVGAFLAASRDGNFEALMAVLAPDVAFRADPRAVQTARAFNWGGRPELPEEARGPRAVAEALHGRARGVRHALVGGAAGAAATQGTKTAGAWAFTIEEGKIVEIELVMDPERLARLDVIVEE